MSFTALDVKKLRDETDAPMMECKAALTEAGGDFDAAKAILREKGKAAAAKRADRSTSAGVVAFSQSADKTTLGGVILECETDFVARNESFIELAQKLADIFRDNEPGVVPEDIDVDGQTVGSMIEAAVAVIRENIKITKAMRVSGEFEIATYVHHDRTKGSFVAMSGDANGKEEVGRTVAIQAVAFPPKFINKGEIPEEFRASEIEIETQRAINEGKKPEIAGKIAQGRFEKEFLKQVVLMEQPLYKEQSISVADFVKQEAKSRGGSIEIVTVMNLGVGQS